MNNSPSAAENVKGSNTQVYVTGAIIALLGFLYFLFPDIRILFNDGWDALLSGDKLRITIWVNSYGWLGPSMLILAMVAQMFLLLIPSMALIVVSIFAYGPFYGSIIAFVGIYAASSVGYVLGEFLGPVVVKKIFGEKVIEKESYLISKYGFYYSSQPFFVQRCYKFNMRNTKDGLLEIYSSKSCWYCASHFIYRLFKWKYGRSYNWFNMYYNN